MNNISYKSRILLYIEFEGPREQAPNTRKCLGGYGWRGVDAVKLGQFTGVVVRDIAMLFIPSFGFA